MTQVANSKNVVFPVTGMTCAACTNHVGNALQDLNEVEGVFVNLATEKATIQISGDLPSLEAINKSLKNAGYGLGSDSITLAIDGMTCTACVSHVESALRSLGGVTEANVNLVTERGSIRYVPGLTSISEMRAAVTEAGYKSQHVQDGPYDYGSTDRDAIILLSKASISIIAAVLIMSAMVFPYPDKVFGLSLNLIFIAIASPIQIWAASQFYVSAWSALRHGTTNMNTLIAIGTSVAYCYSAVQVILELIGVSEGPDHIYFDASCAIVGLVLLGRMLESRARRLASGSIRALLDLHPDVATIIKDGKETRVPTEDVVIGDKIFVRSGERFPVDGNIIDGTTSANESMLTGESMPVAKGADDKVFAATVNGEGSVTYQATGIGKDTVHSQIIQLVEEAQGSKAPIQRLADHISAYFVPTIVILAAITFCIWLILGPEPSFYNAVKVSVAVLVIACPCAMGLATPTAVVVGTGKAASSGILFRNAESLEVSGKVDLVVFDKTGTLTMGEPIVSAITTSPNISEQELLRVAASIEYQSGHPLGKAIVNRFNELDIPYGKVKQFTSVPGMGASGTIDDENTLVAVGNRRYLSSIGVNVPTQNSPIQEIHGSEAHISIDGSYAGKIDFEDRPRPDARDAVSDIKAMGIEVALLSGDNRYATQNIAKEIGIEKVQSEVSPEEKMDFIKEFQSQGKIVAMVGDGVNDAPALETSDLGIALGEGSEVAIQSADVTVI
ncbi:MAG: heavy metal translocating P-type ATPase, partial [Chloroflexota bacterium]|nr:heavy metal translocating P-type ATPase [Chloroflexota bacterium]